MSVAVSAALESAEIIAVGSELLTPWRVATNSLFITRQLDDLGIRLEAKRVVGDDRAEIARVVRDALSRVRLVITIGGLGPTHDDVTRDAVADVLGRPMEVDEAIVEHMRRLFHARGRRMPDVNRRQALVPRGALVLDNPNGTAPGLWMESGESVVVLLPGPPRELTPMLESLVSGSLGDRAPRARLVRRVVKIVGRAESDVEQLVQPVYARLAQPPALLETTILASPGQVDIHLEGRADVADAADAALDCAVADLVKILGDSVFSTDGRTLEQVVGDRLRALRATIATAESCTGGLLMSRLTDVPGSSDYVTHGVIVYSNEAKVELLGVPEPLLEQHGAVSEPVASAMARGVRARLGSDVGVGVSGIAGPGGGTEDKPVGTVTIAVDGPRETHQVRTWQFPGDRQYIKRQATQAALDLVRRAIPETRDA